MYIKVEFYTCKNVDWSTKAAFEAFFKTIEEHFGTWNNNSGSLELSKIRIEPEEVLPIRFNTALFFESANAILTSDVFDDYSKILGCTEGWKIEITETPFDES